MKTAELTGAALDWAVAKCENALWLAYENALNNETPMPPRPSEYLQDYEFHPDHFKPSTDWAQGGPIIEREKLDLHWMDNFNAWAAAKGEGIAAINGYGPTPLIAAMRCYVASKLGDSVEIPENLQP